MKELFKALFAAQQVVKPIEKDSRNAFANFNYVSAESMIEDAREILLGCGLSFEQRGWQLLDATSVRIEYRLVHAESGESDTWVTHVPVVEGKGKPADKALLTALTTDIGYALRGLLCMARVEKGTDTNAEDSTAHTPQPGPATGQPAQKWEPKPRFVPK